MNQPQSIENQLIAADDLLETDREILAVNLGKLYDEIARKNPKFNKRQLFRLAFRVGAESKRSHRKRYLYTEEDRLSRDKVHQEPFSASGSDYLALIKGMIKAKTELNLSDFDATESELLELLVSGTSMQHRTLFVSKEQKERMAPLWNYLERSCADDLRTRSITLGRLTRPLKTVIAQELSGFWNDIYSGKPLGSYVIKKKFDLTDEDIRSERNLTTALNKYFFEEQNLYHEELLVDERYRAARDLSLQREDLTTNERVFRDPDGRPLMDEQANYVRYSARHGGHGFFSPDEEEVLSGFWVRPSNGHSAAYWEEIANELHAWFGEQHGDVDAPPRLEESYLDLTRSYSAMQQKVEWSIDWRHSLRPDKFPRNANDRNTGVTRCTPTLLLISCCCNTVNTGEAEYFIYAVPKSGFWTVGTNEVLLVSGFGSHVSSQKGSFLMQRDEVAHLPMKWPDGKFNHEFFEVLLNKQDALTANTEYRFEQYLVQQDKNRTADVLSTEASLADVIEKLTIEEPNFYAKLLADGEDLQRRREHDLENLRNLVIDEEAKEAHDLFAASKLTASELEVLERKGEEAQTLIDKRLELTGFPFNSDESKALRQTMNQIDIEELHRAVRTLRLVQDNERTVAKDSDELRFEGWLNFYVWYNEVPNADTSVNAWLMGQKKIGEPATEGDFS